MPNNMYEIIDTDEYIDEEGYKRLIISVVNNNTKEQIDIMVKETGLVYIMEGE